MLHALLAGTPDSSITDGERDAAAQAVEYYTPLKSGKAPITSSVCKHSFPLSAIHSFAHPHFGHTTPQPKRVSEADKDKVAAPATSMPAPAVLPLSTETLSQKNLSASDGVGQTPAPAPVLDFQKAFLGVVPRPEPRARFRLFHPLMQM
jgi:hypothetical protein